MHAHASLIYLVKLRLVYAIINLDLQEIRHVVYDNTIQWFRSLHELLKVITAIYSNFTEMIALCA